VRTLGVLRLIAAATTGYALGTIPSADVAARLATRGVTDLRSAGSGNPGAANAMAVLGKGWGYGVLLSDVTKGAAACVLGRRLAGDTGAHVGGTAAVVGHCLPVWNGFRGGKGVAASAGQCLVTFPAYFPIDLGVAWATARWRRQAMVATLAASLTWVAAGVVWWRRRWPNLWGPQPSAALPLAATATSAVILSRFMAARSRAR
jgi:glycerol-3-phosphate acyltransferase PlsY